MVGGHSRFIPQTSDPQIPNVSSTFGTLDAAATAVIARLPESRRLLFFKVTLPLPISQIPRKKWQILCWLVDIPINTKRLKLN